MPYFVKKVQFFQIGHLHFTYSVNTFAKQSTKSVDFIV